jgi:septum formation inhibitor-activating ATPase MinD
MPRILNLLIGARQRAIYRVIDILGESEWLDEMMIDDNEAFLDLCERVVDAVIRETETQ